MEVILRLLKDLQMVLVAICAICCAAFIFTGLASLRDMRRAVFRLERSSMTNRVMGSWLKAGLCALIGVGIVYVTNNIRPAPIAAASDNPLLLTPTPSMLIEFAPTQMPTADLSNAALMMTVAPTQTDAAQPALEPQDMITAANETTQTVDIAAVVTLAPKITEVATLTPLPPATSTPSGQAPTAAPVSTGVVLPILPPQPTAQPTALPSPTPLPTNEPIAAATAPPPAAEAPMVADCGNADALVYNPAPGETVSGGFPIRGTANVPIGGKYRIEILRPNIPGWAFLWENYNQVRDNVLMPSFNPRLFPPGNYTLRLIIVDGAGQETNIYCAVPFKIAE